jgi:plasmid maintenance system antidote protein VapI
MDMRNTNEDIAFAPGRLLDSIKQQYGLSSDRELAEFLDLTGPQISRIRNSGVALTAVVVLKIHEMSGLPISRLKDMCGDRRARHRVGHRSNTAREQA